MESTPGLTCPACTEFEKRLKETSSEFEGMLFDDISELQQSAANGCPLCQLIYQTILYRPPTWNVHWDWHTGSPVYLQAYKYHEEDECPLDDFYESQEEEDEDSGCTWPHFKVILSSVGFPLNTNRDPIPVQYGRITNLSSGSCKAGTVDKHSLEGVGAIATLATKWLSDCSSLHEECKRGTQRRLTNSTIPTRLVDVGVEGAEMCPKLVITNGHEVYSTYTALSYSWGKARPGIKTTASNEQDQTRHIDYSNLSRTIQEAIIMSRKLGVRYIWVDSLCILQSEVPGDPLHAADWKVEAARFGQYYENAVVTIAATGAWCASDGLFLERPGETGNPQPYTVQRLNHSGTLASITIRPQVPLWSNEIPFSPLSGRGWAAQERLMSTRVLHFGANCVSWECNGLQATEVSPFGLTLEEESDSGSYSGKVLEQNFRRLAGIPARLLHYMWYNYIRVFSSKKFGLVSDRLPALSALAGRFQSHLKQAYLDGLWEESVVDGLTWIAHPYFWSPTSAGPEVPTWSWASARGSVDFQYSIGDWRPMAQFYNEPEHTPGLGVSSQVRGKLTIRGRVLITDLATLSLKSGESIGKRNAFERDPENNKHSCSACHGLYLDNTDAKDFAYSSFHCLLLGGMYTYNGSPRPPGLVFPIGVALALVPTGNQRAGVEEYQRIGLLMLPFDEYWAQVTDERDIDLV